jgi:hypothetical protein
VVVVAPSPENIPPLEPLLEPLLEPPEPLLDVIWLPPSSVPVLKPVSCVEAEQARGVAAARALANAPAARIGRASESFSKQRMVHPSCER